jgi:hypothetical protein
MKSLVADHMIIIRFLLTEQAKIGKNTIGKGTLFKGLWF